MEKYIAIMFLFLFLFFNIILAFVEAKGTKVNAPKELRIGRTWKVVLFMDRKGTNELYKKKYILYIMIISYVTLFFGLLFFISTLYYIKIHDL